MAVHVLEQAADNVGPPALKVPRYRQQMKLEFPDNRRLDQDGEIVDAVAPTYRETPSLVSRSAQSSHQLIESALLARGSAVVRAFLRFSLWAPAGHLDTPRSR